MSIKPRITLREGVFWVATLIFIGLLGCANNSIGNSRQESDFVYISSGGKVVKVTNLTRPHPARAAKLENAPALKEKIPECRSAANMEFIEIPAGGFDMGSAREDGYADEHPKHQVYLDAYQIGKYEVCNAQFAEFLKQSGYKPQGDWRHFCWGEPTVSGYPDDFPDYPVINVTWQDARSFCRWAQKAYGWEGCDLPTEAQWEKAARGVRAYLYPWGDDWDDKRCNHWYRGRLPGMLNFYCGRGTLPVGSFPEGDSPYGVADMAGSVWEWCRDWYGADYYAKSPERNPQGPQKGAYRVFRGGSCLTYGGRGYDDTCRSTYRLTQEKKFANYVIGFRCVRKVKTGSAKTK